MHVPFEFVDEIARPACFACSDFANEYNGNSCGGPGSPDGYTTAMVRTTAGEEIYNGARQAGFIQELQFESKEESIIHRTSLKAKIVSFTHKEER